MAQDYLDGAALGLPRCPGECAAGEGSMTQWFMLKWLDNDFRKSRGARATRQNFCIE
jgi:hypothetical protein